MTLIDLIVNASLWLYSYKTVWILCSLFTFLVSVKISRSILAEDMKSWNYKDWNMAIFSSVFFPFGMYLCLRILFHRFEIIRFFNKFKFLAMSMTEIWETLSKNVKFLGVGK